MKRLLSVAFSLLLLAGCVHAPVTEKLTSYQGEVVEAAKALTFDGVQFNGAGPDPVPRRDVQFIEWAVADSKKSATDGPAGAGGLTPLARSLIDRGRAMAQAFPGVGGVILVDDGVFTLLPDGTNTYRYHFAGLVLKEDMKSWAQISLGFTAGRSRMKLLFARIVAADGTVHTLDPAALEEGSPSENASFFNPNRKVMSGLIPGVEVGAIVEYAYEFEAYNPEDPRIFFPGWYFQGTEPVVFSRVKVTVPQDSPFHSITYQFPQGVDTAPAVEEDGRGRTYTWVLEDVPPFVEEPWMPPQPDVSPRMEGSVFADFADSFGFQRKLQEVRIKLTPEIEAKVAEITDGAQDTDAKLARLYHWIQENTKYISIKGSLSAGWSGHTAQETFDNRYGDCTDKSILFVTMCKAIGVTAYPIILKTNDAGRGVTEIPTIEGNHCITEIEFDDRRFYLDTTSQNYRYPYFRPDDHDAVAINAIRGDFQNIPVPPPEDNARHSQLTIYLEDNGDIRAETRNRYTGGVEAGIRGFWKSTREDSRPLRMADYVNSICPGAKLDDFTLFNLEDLSGQLSMNIDYNVPRYAIRAKDLMYLRLPTLERDYAEVALETRRHPIQYNTTELRGFDFRIVLPKGFRALWLPPTLEIDSPYLSFKAAYEDQGDVILFHETFRRLKRIVPVVDYPEYRDQLRAIAAFSKQEVFLTQ